ncbi:MAG TPA: hypothetical protein VF902_04050 [Coriobacteriia bacterium]
MNLAAPALADLRAVCYTDDASLIRTVINAVPSAEAGIAMGLLADIVPERTLVAALNLREILRELPESPFQMRVDFEALARISGLTRQRLSWVLAVGDPEDRLEVELLGQGNLIYDIGVRDDERISLLKPGPVKCDIIRPDALDILLDHRDMIRAVIDLTSDMGIVHNPRFYMTVEDWQLEHAAESLIGMNDLF